MIEMNRRLFMRGVGAFICAPAIVRVSSLMPVRSFVEFVDVEFTEFSAVPMVRFQTWPLETLRPQFFAAGTSTYETAVKMITLHGGCGHIEPSP